jgi:translation initiation factor IF-2
MPYPGPNGVAALQPGMAPPPPQGHPPQPPTPPTPREGTYGGEVVYQAAAYDYGVPPPPPMAEYGAEYGVPGGGVGEYGVPGGGGGSAEMYGVPVGGGEYGAPRGGGGGGSAEAYGMSPQEAHAHAVYMHHYMTAGLCTS